MLNRMLTELILFSTNVPMARLKSKWFWLFVIIISWAFGGVGLCWQAYLVAPVDQATLETIKTAFLVLGGLGVILPTYFNVWQSIENNTVLREQVAWNKKENSFHMIEKWDHEQFVKARKYGRELAENSKKIALDTIMAKVAADADLRQSMICVVNYLDEIRISILANRIDENLVRYSLESSFFYTFQTFQTWLQKESKLQPGFYEDAHKLYIRWNANSLPPAVLKN